VKKKLFFFYLFNVFVLFCDVVVVQWRQRASREWGVWGGVAETKRKARWEYLRPHVTAA